MSWGMIANFIIMAMGVLMVCMTATAGDAAHLCTAVVSVCGWVRVVMLEWE